MATATAYFDESHNGAAYVVAGLAATLPRWQSFESDWAKLLEKHQASAFHAKDYAQRKVDLKRKRGDDPRQKIFFAQAFQFFPRRCTVAVGLVVSRAEFQDTIGQDELLSMFYTNEFATAG